MTDATPPTVLALVRDLMFAGRISAEARAAGVTLTSVRDPAKLSAVDSPAKFLVADLNLPDALEAAAAWKKADPSRDVMAFVAHTDIPTITRARELGIDQVMARSAFVVALPAVLQRLAAVQTPSKSAD